jgi:polysaccharide export outer membrane protein
LHTARSSVRPRAARIVALVAVLALAACASLPRGGPEPREVLRGAEAEGADFRVMPVTRETLPRIAAWPHPGTVQPGWLESRRGGAGLPIAAGDRVSLRVWESDENPLLTAPAARSVEIKDAPVGAAGTIFVPYVGDILVRGLTPDEARAAVQTALDAVLTQPQVQLAVEAGRQNTVDLIGGVARAGSYPLPDRNFSVLSLIGQGGGVPPTLRNPQVRLVRGGQVYGIALATLLADPRRDAVLRGGDKVIVEEDRRYFLALGAASRQDQIYFPQDEVSALDAMALVRGISATRANPSAILVLREYPERMLRADGQRGPDRARMIFTIDLTTADGLFSARNFAIAPEDLVLVTESPLNGLRTILGVIGQAVGIAVAGDAVIN